MVYSGWLVAWLIDVQADCLDGFLIDWMAAWETARLTRGLDDWPPGSWVRSMADLRTDLLKARLIHRAVGCLADLLTV